MPDQQGKSCVTHDPLHCACDEERDRAAGIHRASGIGNAFGGYECVCGEGSFTVKFGCIGGRGEEVTLIPEQTETSASALWRREVTELINLTPHEVTINGCSIPASGILARCSVNAVPGVPLVLPGGWEIPVEEVRLGAVEGLPEPRAGVAYIVPRLTADACPHRLDLYVPNGLIRGNDGVIIGAKGLAQVPRF